MQRFKKCAAAIVGIIIPCVIATVPASALSWIEETDIQINSRSGHAQDLVTQNNLIRCSFTMLKERGACKVATPTLIAFVINWGVPDGSDLLYIRLNTEPGRPNEHVYPVMDTGRTGYHYFFSQQVDTLVISRPMELQGTTQVEVYKDISKTLVQSIDENYGQVYLLPNPSFVLSIPSNGYADTRFGGMSKNGNYFVTQVQNIGLVKINLDSYETELFSRDRFEDDDLDGYLMGVSDDGKSAIVTGRNGTVWLYNVGQTCSRSNFATYLSNDLCPSLNIGYKVFNFLGITSNEFRPAAGIVAPLYDSNREVTIGPYTIIGRRSVKVVSTDDGSAKLDYLALGDSFSSGEGDIGRRADSGKYYLVGTDNENGACHISSRSYPYLLRDMWRIGNEDMQSVACSGAQIIPDYMGGEGKYVGQNGRLAKKQNIDTLQKAALDTFQPGYVQQVEFVKKYRPKMVTLTGGGNDVGFAKVLQSCASFHWSDVVPFTNRTCDYAVRGTKQNTLLSHAIRSQYDSMKKFVDQVAYSSPHTRIIIVGYPSFIAEYDGVLCTGNVGILNLDEMRLINQATNALNDVLKRVAYDTDVEYVDITDSLHGGRLCEGAEYVTGVASRLIGAKEAENFHPNAKGHQKIAQKIDNSNVYAKKLVPPEIALPSTYTPTFQKTLYTSDAPIYYGEQKQIESEPGLLQAHSQYDVWGHSEPVHLGTFTARPDGSANATVSLADLPPGQHMLELRGTAPDGTPIVYYQFIEVRYSADDADGDGIKDVDDKCNFITNWYDEATGKDVCASDVPTAAGNLAPPTSPLAANVQKNADQPWYVVGKTQYLLDSGMENDAARPFSSSMANTSLPTEPQSNEFTRKLVFMAFVFTAVIMVGIVWGRKQWQKNNHK